MFKHLRRLWYVLAIVVVTVIGLWLRFRAVDLLPIDYDEDDYLAAGQRYAQAIADGNLDQIINYDFNYEHPPLTKLVYGLTILSLPEVPLIPELPSTTPPATSLPEPHFQIARSTSAMLGGLQVLALAIFDPLAGLFLAIHTWQIKYTSQIMLEPLPSLTSTLAVLFYVQSRHTNKTAVWRILSAIALGITAAAKYPYCMAGVAIVIDWLWQARPAQGKPWRSFNTLARWLGPVVVWGLISLVIFFIFNPRLWNDPFHRLAETILYHGSYAQSDHVSRAGFPFWQPFVWLFGSVPWHPGVFVFSLDLLITLLAVFGLKRLWSKEPVFVIWLGVALGFLLVWPTKWPQYILILTVPLAAASAAGFRAKVWEPFLVWFRFKQAGKLPKKSRPPKIPAYELRRAILWLLPGAIVLGIIALYPLIYQMGMALTDFNTVSIRDGINGGIRREVWRGLTGQVEPVDVEMFSGTRPTGQEVHYVGPGMLLRFFSGLGADVLFFNVMWTLLSVALQTVVGVSAALLIHQRLVRFKNVWRAIFILPWAIPEFVGAVVWFRIFEPRFGWLHLAALPSGIVLPEWMDNPASALPVLLIAATWYGFPFMMLAATASLKLIPTDVYHASAMDGAGGWAQFRYITWPLLQPLLIPAIIIRAIFAFNQFYLFYVMQADFPTITLATISFFVFNYGGQFAVSAALNVFTVVVLVVLILWFNRQTKALEGVTYV